LTQDACAFYDDHTLLRGFSGVVLDIEEGRRIAETLADAKAVILQNHGFLTVGHTVDEAAWWYITMERTCQSQLLAEGAATAPISIDRETAVLTRSQIGTHEVGRFNFKPLWDRITREQPDLFEGS